MNMTDAQWEKKLNIVTGAAYHEKDDAHHSRYEPTSYAVLERLAASGHIGKGDVLVDYGCGKGRVGFFMSNAVGCKSVGVEYDPKLHAMAMENLKSYSGRRENVSFMCESAENYIVIDENCFYFFNPFSANILRGVMGRIYESYYESPRSMKLFFYYALDEYLTYLMTESMLNYTGEIDCRDIFPGSNEKERILIFTTG